LKKVEYSQPARQRMKKLREELTEKFGTDVSKKAIKKITSAIRGLSEFEKKGVAVSSMYDVDCDYRYLYVSHNYLFYRIERDRIIIIAVFDDREDFMRKLFGMPTITQESEEYWNE